MAKQQRKKIRIRLKAYDQRTFDRPYSISSRQRSEQAPALSDLFLFLPDVRSSPFSALLTSTVSRASSSRCARTSACSTSSIQHSTRSTSSKSFPSQPAWTSRLRLKEISPSGFHRSDSFFLDWQRKIVFEDDEFIIRKQSRTPVLETHSQCIRNPFFVACKSSSSS